jgi:hypothetical protein
MFPCYQQIPPTFSLTQITQCMKRSREWQPRKDSIQHGETLDNGETRESKNYTEQDCRLLTDPKNTTITMLYV